MSRPRGITRQALSICILGLLSIAAFGDDKYVKSKDPVFPAVQPDHALVYFARPDFTRLIPEGTFKVFVDSTPTGWLPQRSYMAAQVDPGSRVVWGPMDATQRFDFQAGKTYFLILVEQYGAPNRAVVGASWTTGDPAYLQGFIADKKLSYVKANEETLVKLREEGAKKLEKEQKRAPEVHAAALPATFDNVWYRPGDRGFAWKPYDATGTLVVNSETIEYKSDKKNIVIPLKDVHAVALGRFAGFVNSGDESQWGMVRFNAATGEEIAAFSDKRGRPGTEQIFLTLQSAVPASSATPPPQQTLTAPAPQVANVALQEQSQPQPAPSQWADGTRADAQLAADIKRMIRTFEDVDHPHCAFKVVKQFHSADKPGVERWDVKSCDAASSYDVTIVASPRGGSDFRVVKSKSVVALDKSTDAAAPTPVSLQVATPALPEGFVLYEGSKDQFTIGLPKDWTAYDQGQILKAAGMERMAGRGGDMIIFYQSKDSTAGSMLSPELMGKVDTGDLPSFFLQKQRADKGMSCADLSEKAEKKLVDLIAKDPQFKGKNALEPTSSEPAIVGGCKGIRVRAKGKSEGGSATVVDAYIAADGQTVYVFSLRNRAENFDKNEPVFHQAISTLKLAAAELAAAE